MHFKRIGTSKLQDLELDFDSNEFNQMGSLKEDEMEFLQSRKLRRTMSMYAPDPRKRSYDEES